MSVIYEWTKTRLTGEQLKYAKSLADSGVGYVVLSSGYDQSTREKYAIMAFKRALSQIPDHLEICSKYESDKLEIISNKRMGGVREDRRS